MSESCFALGGKDEFYDILVRLGENMEDVMDLWK